jgi:nucleotide-binding universal stress UspA family protein
MASAPSSKPSSTDARAARPNPLYQDIIVFQDDNEASLTALRYAQTLAASSDGNVTGLVFGMLAAYPMTVYADALPSTWMALQEKASAVADALEKRVTERVDRTLFPVEIRRVDVMGGEAGGTLAMHARYADLAVVGLSRGGGTDFEQRLFEGVLFGAGRPVMVVPEALTVAKVPRRILVGWRPTSEAARAVHDAMPILEAAEAVRVLVVDERSALPEGDDPGADIARHLARHDVPVDVKCVPTSGRSVTERLMEEARYFGADLIVLGGYGHSRLREWMLGGVTRDILTLSDAPILFSH